MWAEFINSGQRMEAYNLKAVRAENVHVPVIGLLDGIIDCLYEKHLNI